MRLGCALLFVKDLARMREFYTAMLGAPPVSTQWTNSWALFETGGSQLALHAIPAEAAQEVDIASPPRAREQSAVKLIFHVPDIRTEQGRLEAMGVTILKRSWQNPRESFDAMDPEGNVFQIAQGS